MLVLELHLGILLTKTFYVAGVMAVFTTHGDIILFS